MQTSYKSLIILVLAITVSAKLGQQFDSLLSGQEQLTPERLLDIYSKFLEVYRTNERGLNFKEYLLKKNPHIDRKQIFEINLKEVIQHNSDPSQSYKKGINHYSDFTQYEFLEYYNILNAAQDQCQATEGSQSLKQEAKDSNAYPTYWDWRDHNGVTPVKDQGNCGSCWTFSTVGSMEAHFYLKYKTQKYFSEQQLVDCAQAFDNHGCNGGLPSHAFEYIGYARGLASETAYPYTGLDGACYFQSSMSQVTVVGGSTNITAYDEVELLQALYDHGPVSVAFQVVAGFSSYTSGIYTSTTCQNKPENVNHAVLAVGYGTEGGKDYWIVKNSWGADWGDQGYFKIVRGVNMCGIAVCNSFPTNVIVPRGELFLNQ